MKIFWNIAVILLFAFRCLNAQVVNEPVRLWSLYEGYVITHDDDTIKGYIKLINLVRNQKKAMFYEGKYDEKPLKIYRPGDIEAYRVGPRVYESFKFKPIGTGKGKYFFLRKINGPIRLYEWYYEPSGLWSERQKIHSDELWSSEVDFEFSESNLTEEKILIKLDQDPESLTEIAFITNFLEKMSQIVKEHKDLAEKIENNQQGYRLEDLEKIIREYNAWYLSKNQ